MTESALLAPRKHRWLKAILAVVIVGAVGVGLNHAVHKVRSNANRMADT